MKADSGGAQTGVTEQWARVKALFSVAIELPQDERAAFVAREAAGDDALRAEVLSLLDSHARPGEFLDTVKQEFRAEAFSASGAARSRIGERIGSYRIVGVLGSGGMGDVFKAVRDDEQYEAEVAIKLMRADVRSAMTEIRFRNERQILAQLDHRNIARLLDGGASVGGMPYVVMELVVGEPIDQYCDAHQLGVRERVQLFLQVCAAVSYAHQHLVVHRDLKPNNILVTADRSVKLLDFGIAKLVEPAADTVVSPAEQTATTMRAMTLDYASPEQVAGGTVTTVSDVYSLGVVLYRLLTGKSPYGARVNDAQRMAEILSDTTPTRPSLVERRIDGDLDNILLMTLRKEPQRRYGSVEQLANDLRNYLTGMPVHARGNALRYRLGKFVRRRKVELAAGVLVAAALLGALAVSLREARIADHERQVAQQHFDSVRKLAGTLLFELHDEIAKVPGSMKTRELLVKTSLEYLDTLYKGAGTDRALQEELGRAYKRIGDIQGDEGGSNTGEHAAALKSYARAIALLEPLAAQRSIHPSAAVNLSRTYVQQANVMLSTGRLQEGLASIQKAVALSESMGGSGASDAERASQLGNAYWVQADLLARLDRSPEAMASVDKMLGISEEFWRRNPKDIAALLTLSNAYNNAADKADTRVPESERYQRTLFLLRRSLWASDQLIALAPDEERHRYDRALTQYNLARQLAVRQDFSGALGLLRTASVPLGERAKDASDSRAQYLSALIDSALGEAEFKLGQVENAGEVLLRCDRVFRGLLANGGTLRIEYGYGQNSVRLGTLYSALAQDARAPREARLAHWRKARDAFATAVPPLKKVAAAVSLDALDFAQVTAAVEGLERSEAAVARLTRMN